MKKKIVILSFYILLCISFQAKEISIKITKQYLNFPISHTIDRAKMQIKQGDDAKRSFVIRLASDKPDYWVFSDVSEFKGKTLTISYEGVQDGLNKIYQSDEIEGENLMYKEKNRPQFHYTARRGWINDPNGLIYYDGEYHLFYQHNPYEKEWENMHWGHAVSTDLIHWKELPEALYPDKIGTMFSGTTVIDYDNTAGFNKGNNPAMIAIYTADSPDREVQCIAYSLDKGRTWTKYKENPVLDTKEIWNSRDTRDPKVFWYKPTKNWVMVLNERDGHSIYTSNNLKEWKYESHVTGFWECPELFPLAVDGNKNNMKWVMYGASGTYMIGSFDGKKFKPESGKYYYVSGALYAGQTIANLPKEDERRIQIAWGKISHPDMPFTGQMQMPTEFSLRTTKDGVRLFSKPIKELDTLFTLEKEKSNLTSDQANQLMSEYKKDDLLRIKTTIKLSHATSAGIDLCGQRILDYDMNSNIINGRFYSPEDMTSMELNADIYIDKTSIEVFIDGGAYTYSIERRSHNGNNDGVVFWGNQIQVKDVKVYSVKSIWK